MEREGRWWNSANGGKWEKRKREELKLAPRSALIAHEHVG